MTPAPHDQLVTTLLRHPRPPGEVVRLARTALKLTQAQLGRRCSTSASQISRWETAAVPLRDLPTLRRLADALGLPPRVFGIADGAPPEPSAVMSRRVGPVTDPRWEDDPVRRRSFLIAAGLTLTTPALTAAATPADPAQLLAHRLGDVLLGTTTGQPTPIGTLRADLATARQDFTACRYTDLATRLPVLLAAAEATAAEHSDPGTELLLAEAHQLTTRVLLKLEQSGLEWMSADRGIRAARRTGNGLTLAESQRLVASVARRAGDHDRAQAITLGAVGHLTLAGPRPDPGHLLAAAGLYCSAGYAAARAGDRDRATDLLTDAETTAARITGDSSRRQAATANVISHRVSAAYLLGDSGTALAHAHAQPLTAIPTTERQARLLIDTALAYHQHDHPTRAYQTLLTAERLAPGELRTRSTAKRLITTLLDTPSHTTMPGLPALATRTGIPA